MSLLNPDVVELAEKTLMSLTLFSAFLTSQFLAPIYVKDDELPS